MDVLVVEEHDRAHARQPGGPGSLGTQPREYVVLDLLVYTFFTFRVGTSRAKYEVAGYSARMDPSITTAVEARSLRRIAFLVLLALPLLLGACVMSIGPTISDRTPEELGPYPDDYRGIAKRWIEDNVRGISGIDRLSVSKPRPGFADSILSRRRFGWWTQVSFRARDRLGLPKGRMSWALLVHDCKVIAQQKRLD